MHKQLKRFTTVAAGVAMLSAVGCASTDTMPASEAQRQLEERQRELSAAESALRERDRRIEALSGELKQSRLPAVSAAPPGGVTGSRGGSDMLPPSAKAGECYARTFAPPTYSTREIQKQTRAASERIDVVPARYELVDERVLVREASERLEVVPATYENVTDRVMVKEASFMLKEVPAVYETREEKVLVTPAETVWKKGRGPIERINDATGEIMCLVDVPAVYKTVRERVLVTPATTKRVEIPAEYKTVTRRVVKTPATTRKVSIPAKYDVVKVRKLAEPAKEKRIEIPAQFQTVSTRELASEGKLAWRPVLCETNATRDVVVSIQRALDQAGHNPGPIDGIIGSQTLAAVKSYQQAKKLPTGGLTYATIDSLGVTVKK